jgi:integrase
MAATAHLTLVAPDNEKFTVQSALDRLPRRKPNAEYRSREHLTEREVEWLIVAMKDNRWGHRDATMVLMAFRNGLRAWELVDLRWEQVDLANALLHVRRVKQGSPATHPIARACGFKLANDGVDTRTIQAYLGHKSIQHSVRYTELAPTRFKSLFRD